MGVRGQVTVAAAALVAAGGAGHGWVAPEATRGASSGPLAASSTATPVPSRPPSGGVPPRGALPAPPPTVAAAAPGAVAVAGAYVTQALSYTWHEASDAWVGRVAPLCTPEWLAVLRAPSADGGGATWAAVLASHATATAQVLGTYPGAGPGPGQRLYVRAALDVTAGRPPGQPAARRRITMVVDVVAVGGGRWLVGWAG